MVPIIMIDASCDLPLKFVEENNIPYVGLVCHFKGKDYEDDFGKTLPYSEFYKGLKEGEYPTTSQVNVFKFMQKFKELIKENRPIIYIGMSSGLSGTVNTAKLSSDAIMDEYKDADITVIDTKCSSIGEGLLVYQACNMAKKGSSKEEIITWVEENMVKVNHWFIVQDLKYLKRGGRISSTSAIIGTILNIKPIVYIMKDGTLKNIIKIRGKKKAERYLLDKFKELNENPENSTVAITHADCLEDAHHLEKLLKNEFNVKETIINYLGIGMGTHCGRGMLSLCFIGKTR